MKRFACLLLTLGLLAGALAGCQQEEEPFFQRLLRGGNARSPRDRHPGGPHAHSRPYGGAF